MRTPAACSGFFGRSRKAATIRTCSDVRCPAEISRAWFRPGTMASRRRTVGSGGGAILPGRRVGGLLDGPASAVHEDADGDSARFRASVAAHGPAHSTRSGCPTCSVTVRLCPLTRDGNRWRPPCRSLPESTRKAAAGKGPAGPGFRQGAEGPGGKDPAGAGGSDLLRCVAGQAPGRG